MLSTLVDCGRAALRWFGVALFSSIYLGCLALAPLSAGSSMVVGAPALLAAIWLVRHDPGDRPDASSSDLIVLGAGVLIALTFLAWTALSGSFG